MASTELIAKAKQGDSQAFGEIYDEYAQRIFKFIKFKVTNQQEAEDLLQSVFLKAWQHLPRLRMENLNFSAWLYRIALNSVNDYYRKHYRSFMLLPLDDHIATITSPATASGDYRAAEIRQTIEQAFSLLPPQYKEILELRFIQEFSVKEVAEITGKSSLAIRVTQFRALKRLREILQNHYDYGYEKI